MGGCRPEDVLLVDDQEAYVVAAQRGQWIPIPEFQRPFAVEDDALEAVRRGLERLLTPGSGRP